MGTAPAQHPLHTSRAAMLHTYFEMASQNLSGFIAAALRIRSSAMRDVLVFGALGLEISSEALKNNLLNGNQEAFRVLQRPTVLAELGRLVILQNIFSDDIAYGIRLIEAAYQQSPAALKSKSIRKTLIEAYISSRLPDHACSVVDMSPDIRAEKMGHLVTELANPFIFPKENRVDSWLSKFNEIFDEHQIAKLSLSSDEELKPFDRLTVTQHLQTVGDESDSPLVSIILTAYRPTGTRLKSSVRSVLNQTWQNIEVIIVDDYSGPEFTEVFTELEGLDDRVRVISAPQNQGTYLARNIGFGAARGEFITGQDDDDWSHPQRLEYQVRYMLNDPNAVGCRVKAVRCDENLGLVRVGDSWLGQNASSLLIKREALQAIGGFLPARKAADTEYYLRLTAVTGQPVVDLKEPLSVIRVLDDSLSRGDFGPGWRHSSRRTFRSSYEYWHRTSPPRELRVEEGIQPRVKIPRRFKVSQPPPEIELDVVFAGDWEKHSRELQSMLEKVRALSGSGLRVGILNLDTDWFATRKPQRALHDDIQRLVNDGLVEEVLYDEPAAIRLLILHNPVTLQFPPHDVSGFQVRKLAVIVDTPPNSGEDDRWIYRPDECCQNALEHFGVEPEWIPRDPYTRFHLLRSISSKNLAHQDSLGVVDVRKVFHRRFWYRSIYPVVGCYFPTSNAPVIDEIRRAAAALDVGNSTIDLRLLGAFGRRLRARLEKSIKSASGVYEVDNDAAASTFSSLDYFLYIDTSEGPARANSIILNAIASGVIVILPPKYETIYGASAVYCDLKRIRAWIDYLHSDFSIYLDAQDKCRTETIGTFSYQAYQSRTRRLLALMEAGVNQ